MLFFDFGDTRVCVMSDIGLGSSVALTKGSPKMQQIP